MTDPALDGPLRRPPPDAGDDPIVPGWLRRLAAIGWRVLAALALGLVLVYVAILLSTVTAAIVVAMIVACTFAPYVQRLRARGMDRTRAALVVTGAAVLIAAVTVTLLVVAFVPYADDVAAFIRTGVERITTWLESLGTGDELPDAIQELLETARSVVQGLVTGLIGPIASLVTVLILGGFLTFFLLQDGDKAWASVTRGMDAWRADALTRRGHVAVERVGGYLRGTAIMAATDALTDLVYLTLLGVPLAAPLAVLVFLGGFVPYVGGFIATSILLLVTLATAGPTAAVILITLITITNIVQGNVIAPVVYGRTVEIHPALVLVALPAGAALFGIIGLFAALPLVALVAAVTPAVIAALDAAPGSDAKPGIVPIWLDRLGQWSWRGLVVVALLAVLIRIAVIMPTVIVPIVLAVVLAATLAPLAMALRRRGARPAVAAAAVTFLTALAVIVVVGLTFVSMVSSASGIVDLSAIGAAKADIGDWATALVTDVGEGIVATVLGIARSFAGLVVVLILSTLLTFYLLKDGARWWSTLLTRVRGRHRDRLIETGPKAMGILSGYMFGTALISLFGAFTQWLIMVILGLPLALPVGVLSFFGGFIPYIGSAITTLIGFLVALAVGDSTDVVIMFVFTIVFNIVQGNFVAPLVYGRTVSLHPAVVLLAIPAGGAVAGILGMFLVVPFLGVVAVTWRAVIHSFDLDDDQPVIDAGPDPAIIGT